MAKKIKEPELVKVDPAIADQVVTRNETDRARIRAAAIRHNQEVEAHRTKKLYEKGVSKKERRQRRQFVKDAQAAAQKIKAENSDMENVGKRAEEIGNKLEEYLAKDN